MNRGRGSNPLQGKVGAPRCPRAQAARNKMLEEFGKHAHNTPRSAC